MLSRAPLRIAGVVISDDGAAKRATDYLRNTIQLDYYRINTATATTDDAASDDAANDHDGRKHDRNQTAAFARRWAGLAQTRRTGPVFKF